ncbi:N-acyl-D-amino-acid deacylase family protein [Mycolicibacterium neworleansense]|uniref:N-acyl-D-aspartate deacylase n=1 Tax=Mycolicibacterium neworleansense TaxID=146018 RepID=A0A0H5RI80_9MYCO|nr:amidohydrolase family protein [Mycolicibacterium neworleansense]MCV7362137.1 amidohydrolase family protein [Mycolicibacterium neworleansense]CRZ13456.1 N-acyl-D-aspartate deacylase [Mycolicibacterium neworleansense]
MPALDYLLTGADIVDGTGTPTRRADVGIRGDRIAFVGLSPDVRAVTTLDCTGMIITPGLIDPHSHSDWSVLGNPDALSTIHQGVTTEVVGNCGVTYAPIGADDVDPTAGALRAMGYDGPVDWRSFGEFVQRVHSGPTTQNLMWFVGHTAIRGAARSATDPLRTQIRLLEEAMEAGAIGFSSGLEYGSGRFAATEELMALAQTAGRRDGMYASHIRNRDAELDTAVDEFFAVVDGGQIRAQLSHLNVRHDTGAQSGAWERAAERVVTERQRGTDVLADMTPYPHGIGMATGLLPGWLAERPADEAAKLLKDREVREQVRRDSDRYWRFLHRGQWHRVRLGVSPTHPDWEGLSFTEIAERHGTDEWECLFDILTAAGADMGSVQLIGELFTPDHLAEAIAHDHFLLGVDAFTTCRHGVLDSRTRNPLFYHGHTHYLAHHVPAGTLSLETAIHKMTGMVAGHFGMRDRGELRASAFADVVVFDPAILDRTDTWTLPARYADAARHVWVNGVPVVTDAAHTGRRPGLMLTHRP